VRLVVTSRRRIVYFMYVYRRRIDNFIVFFFVSLKRYCIYILEMLDCVLAIAIDAFVNIEACSFVVIL